MPKINLAQEALRSRIIARRRRMIYLLAVLILVVVSGVEGLFLLLTRRVQGQVKDIRQDVVRLESKLQARGPVGKEIVMFRERLSNIEKLLRSHVHWMQIFEELERLSLPDITFISLKGDAKSNNFEVKVRAPNVEVIADLIASLQNQAEKNETSFGEVTLTALGPVGSGIQEGEEVKEVSGGYLAELKFVARKGAFAAPRAAAVTPPPSSGVQEVTPSEREIKGKTGRGEVSEFPAAKVEGALIPEL